MATDKIRGITIELSGDTSNLVKSLKDVDSSVKSTQKQLKDVDRLLKLDPKNTELLKQKQQLLAKSVEETNNKLKELDKIQKEMDARGIDKNSEQYQALQREIISTEHDLENLENKTKEFGSVGAQHIAGIGKELENVGQKMSSIGDSLTTKVTLPIAAGFTVAAKSASDYEENLNKISVAFGEYSNDVTDWATNVTEDFGLSQVAATGMVSSFGALSKGIGSSEKMAAEMSMTLTGLSSDLASYFNTGTDEAAKALEGIFTGEAEALKKFGVIMNDTNLKQFANDHGLVYEKLTQLEKAQLRYFYVLQKTKDAQGDYARTSDGTANSIKTFTAALQNLATAIGTQVLPIITPIIQALTKVINAIANMPEPLRKVIVIIGLIVAAAGPIISMIGRILIGVGQIMSFAPMIMTAISSIGTALSGLFAMIVANPIPLLIGAIVGLVIALVVLIVKNIDIIKVAFQQLGEYISNVFKSIGQGIVDFFVGIVNAVRNMVMTIINWLKALFNLGGKVASSFGGGGMMGVRGGVARMANGGTISSGASLVGENGPELLTMVGNKARITPLTNGQANSALQSISGGDVNVKINFEGSLSQLARVLQPEIQVETTRKGMSLINA